MQQSCAIRREAAGCRGLEDTAFSFLQQFAGHEVSYRPPPLLNKLRCDVVQQG